jgi:predicted transcriptional regulator
MPDPLELESRRRIYNFVKRNPGVYMREIQRALGLGTGVLQYQLDYLVKKGLLSIYVDGRRKRYYCAENVSAPDKGILAMLRQRVPRRMMMVCIEENGADFRRLMEFTASSKSNVSFHLSRLLKMGIMEEREENGVKRYYVREPERISELIITYQESYLDDLVDRFVESFAGI